MIKVYEFCGMIGSGKTYIAKKMMNETRTNVVYLPFAKRLKEYLSVLDVYKNFPVDVDELFSYQRWLNLLEMINKDGVIELDIGAYDKFKRLFWERFFDVKPKNVSRFVMQLFGTDFIRGYDENYWTKTVVNQIKDLVDKGDYEVYIDDYRFFNEDLKFLDDGKNIIVERIKVVADKETILRRLMITESEYMDILGHRSEQYIIYDLLPYDRIIENN